MRPFFGAVGLLLERSSDASIDLSAVEGYIEQAGKLLAWTYRGRVALPSQPVITISGLEPFDLGAPLTAWARVASDCGMLPQFVTSGSWVDSAKTASAAIAPLKNLANLVVIAASDHPNALEGLEWIDWLVEACRHAGIRTCLTCNVTRDTDMLRRIAALESVNVNSTMIQVLPTAAPRELENRTDGAALMLSSTGKVHFCNQGHECRASQIGDLTKDLLQDIVARAMTRSAEASSV